MRSYWSGASGRYAASCENGHCALAGTRATSKLEGSIFSTLDYALGPGASGDRIGPYNVDMLFPLAYEGFVAIEYDGAYWHADGRERDIRKSDYLRGCGLFVVRVRECPLLRLSPYDVRVPSRADAATVVRLTALHLFHLSRRYQLVKPNGDVLHDEAFGPLIGLLRSDSRPLKKADVRCRECWATATELTERGLLRRDLLTTGRRVEERRAKQARATAGT